MITYLVNHQNLSAPKKYKIKHTILKVSLACLILIPMSDALSAVAQFKPDDDQRFKAAFIYNFAKFTNWPENAFNENDPFILCTIGIKNSSNNLDRLSGKTIKDRKLSIVIVKAGESISHCHMLYIDKSAKVKLKQLLKLTFKKPILTVSDMPSFSKNGGMIQFYRKEGKTHLIINLDTTRESNLKISSRLLILAKVISNNSKP